MGQPQLPLRPYQATAIDAVRKAWADGVPRPAVVLPTGAGKTVVFSHMAAAENGRTLILVHRRELADQAAAKIAAVAPRMRLGIEMADNRANTGCRAVVASVQTLASERRRRRWERDAFTQVIVDECHHAAAPTYLGILDYFGCMADSATTRTAGFTATLARGDGVGLGGVWQRVAYTRTILEMIADGYLVNPAGISVPIGVDLGKAEVSRGDYTAGSLGTVLEESGFDSAVAKVWAEHAAGRPGIVFTPTVATAQAAAAALKQAGFAAEAVWGDMDDAARRNAVEGLRDGGLDVLCNCNVLTEGTDIPRAAVALMGRPTRSKVLFQQMAGRVLRPHPEKTDALIIDIVGVTADSKLCTLLDLADGQVPERQETDRAGDGETLAGAVERISSIKLGAARNVDLFTESRSVWLRTAAAGYWFIPAGGGHIALLPGPGGQYAVALFPPGNGPPKYSEPVPDLALAMALGEARGARADDAARVRTADRASRWRGAGPSAAQLGMCTRMRIDVPPGATAGDVSDLISAKIASRRIDRFLAARLSRRPGRAGPAQETTVVT